jgi:hypothetical protein
VLYGLGNSYTVMMSGQAKQELVARLAPAILLLRPQRGWSMAHRFGAVYGTPEVRGCDFRLLWAVHMLYCIHGKGVRERGQYDGHDQLQEKLSHTDWYASQAACSKHKQSLVPQAWPRIVGASCHNKSGAKNFSCVLEFYTVHYILRNKNSTRKTIHLYTSYLHQNGS